jgi:hypothetical protein
MIAIDVYYANQSHPNSSTSKLGFSRFNQTLKMANKSETNQLKESHKRAFSEFRAIKSQETQKRELSSKTKPSTNFNTTNYN